VTVEKLQKQGFWLHIARLCVVLLLLSALAQAAHTHAGDRNSNHCAACFSSHSPVMLVPVVSVPMVAANVGFVLAHPERNVSSHIVLSACIRPPPSAL
jgi:hypothetical protein